MSAVEKLAKIQARADNATPGPWELSAWDSGHSRFEMSARVITADVGDLVADMDGLSRTNNERHALDDGTADAEFIAHTRQDVPALVAALRAVLALTEDPGAIWTRSDGRTTEVIAVSAEKVRATIEDALP